MIDPTNKAERTLRTTMFCACEIFAVCTLVMMFKTGDSKKLLMCIATIVLVCAPGLMERIFSCKIRTPAYIFFLFYIIGPMTGYCHELYYLTNWWDKLLHTCGGVVFSLLGAYLFRRCSGQQKKYVLCAVFAFCFSVTVSVLWEFYEFTADAFTGSDLQNDTVITALHSYYLSETAGVTGSIENISRVVVEGIELPVNGYLDIGLIDSMLDMMLETLGALVVAVIGMVDKGKHAAIVSTDEL